MLAFSLVVLVFPLEVLVFPLVVLVFPLIVLVFLLVVLVCPLVVLLVLSVGLYTTDLFVGSTKCKRIGFMKKSLLHIFQSSWDKLGGKGQKDY